MPTRLKLFGGTLLSLHYYAVDTAICMAFGFAGFQAARAAQRPPVVAHSQGRGAAQLVDVRLQRRVAAVGGLARGP